MSPDQATVMWVGLVVIIGVMTCLVISTLYDLDKTLREILAELRKRKP